MEMSNEQREREGGGRAAFRKRSRRQKLQYIWEYEKLPLLGILVLLVILGSVIVRQISKKNVLLTAAAVNVGFGEDTEKILKTDYEAAWPGGSRKNEVRIYKDLFVGAAGGESGNPEEGQTVDGASYEYAYASSMKLLALMTDKALDAVFMDESAYEQFSRNGYLMNLPEIEALAPYQESMSGSGDAVSLNGRKLAEQAGFDGEVWIGIIQNTQRREAAIQYLSYCMAE